MELLKLAVQIAIGLAAGGFTAAGYFAVITSVGMINRIVDVTNTKAYIPYFEEVIIWGASLGNVWFIFDLPLPAGMPGAVLYGLLSGMFIGLFAVSLAENTCWVQDCFVPYWQHPSVCRTLPPFPRNVPSMHWMVWKSYWIPDMGERMTVLAATKRRNRKSI